MDQCMRERFLVVDEFLPDDEGRALRADVDAHFSNPDRHGPDHQVWNYWHVPGLYTYLRATPQKVIAETKVKAFVDRLRNWAAVNLGLASVTWPYLSLYVPGCGQGLHNDSTNGRLGYVYSLTRNERATVGGETLLMQDGDLFRANLDRAAAGTGLYDLVAPRFNRLTLFDDRIPHGVQRVDGSMDPVEGRIVLHGHISEGGVVTNGPLSPNIIQEPVVAMLAQLRAGVARGAQGPLVYRVEIAPDGSVRAAGRILDRLASTGEADLDAVRDAAASAIHALRFPAASDPTRANIPLMF